MECKDHRHTGKQMFYTFKGSICEDCHYDREPYVWGICACGKLVPQDDVFASSAVDRCPHWDVEQKRLLDAMNQEN